MINIRRSVIGVTFVGLAFITGCATTSAPVADTDELKTELVQFASRDFLAVFTQLLPPRSTTIQLGRPTTLFGEELEEGFRETGYGLQRVGADQGPYFIAYSESTQHNSDQRKTYTYRLNVGDIGAERTYINVRDAGVFPAGPMILSGTTQKVELSPELFQKQSGELDFMSEVKYVTDANAVASVTPKITLINDKLLEGLVQRQRASLPSYKTLNSQNIEIENLYSRGVSNFETVDKEYRVVRKDIIIFGDDSLRLKNRGKSQITRLAGFFNDDTDIFRLVGCSNGPTKHGGGNEALALGRSKRVAEALLAKGVKQSSILDEGCWAPVSSEEYPSRGVVIELKRKI